MTLTYLEGQQLIEGAANRRAVRTTGRNATYHLGPNTTLLFNAGSVEPRLDGWWLDEVAHRHFGLGPRRICQEQADQLLETARQLGTLEVL